MSEPRYIPAGTTEDVTDDHGRKFRICGPATVTETAVYFPTIDSFLTLRDWDAVFIRHAQAAARCESGPQEQP